MTNKRLLIFICCSLFLLSGCQQNDKSSSSDKTESTDSGASSAADIDVEKIDYSSLTAPAKGNYTEYDNPIEYYTEEEAKKIVSDTTDFKISSECYFSVPKKIDHVSTFVQKTSEQDSLYDFYRSYLELYKYLFPDAEFDDNNLFYYGANSNNQISSDQVKTIGKNFSDFLSEDKKDVYYMFYSPYFYDGQPSSDDTYNHFLELSSPVGTLMTNFNKGYLAKYVAEMYQEPNDHFLETKIFPGYFSTFDPQTGVFAGFGPSTLCDVDSDAVHTMLDGSSLSVRDAVSFFEDYINTLPYPKNPNLDIKVTDVIADEINDGKFCYSFQCTAVYEGIPYDYESYGTMFQGDGYEGYAASTMRMGYMSVSDDVDAAYGFYRSLEISDRTDATEIVSFEDALECCESSMSDFANWELESAEIVYCPGGEKKAEAPYQHNEYTVTPCYKFKMYNSNDSLYYSVYVDAITGEFERYFTTRS